MECFPGSVVEDSALDNRAVMIGGTTGILGEWGPEREDNRYEGRDHRARRRSRNRKNGATVRLGMHRRRRCRDSTLPRRRASGRSCVRIPATFLGSSEITLAELALAYTIFPNGGWRPDSSATFSIGSKKRTARCLAGASRTARGSTVIKPETAYEVHSCLVDALAIRHRQSARDEIWPEKISGRGKNRDRLRFHRCAFRRLR